MKARLLLVAAAVCLAPPARAQLVMPWRHVQLPGMGGFVSLDTVGTVMRVPGAPAAIFANLRLAYDHLHVRLELDDSAAGMLGTLRVARSQSFAGVPLSRLLDCGMGSSGPWADASRIQFALVSFVDDAPGDSTALRTALVGSAQSVDGSQQDAIQCSSTGWLETWLRGQVAPMPAGRRR